MNQSWQQMTKKYIHKELNYLTGYLSEIVIILFLKMKGFTLIKHRYKNEIIEIDIIAKKNQCILFGEVKFRKSLKNLENYVNYPNCLKIHNSSEQFLQNFPEFLKYQSIFKLFLLTKNLIKIITIY
jgi:putative endonuclease